MNTIRGIDEIVYGADDLAACKQFFLDWGLALQSEDASGLLFETLNGCRCARQAQGRCHAAGRHGSRPDAVRGDLGAPIRRLCSIAWSTNWLTSPGYVHADGRVGCTDPNGLAVRVQLTTKRDVDVQCAAMNTWTDKPRRNQPSPIYARATPIEVGHVVFFVKDVAATERFYIDKLGFVPSDHYPGRGAFLRCEPEGGHHDLFLLQTPQAKSGLNHVAFTVRDIHEVFGGWHACVALRLGNATRPGSSPDFVGRTSGTSRTLPVA